MHTWLFWHPLYAIVAIGVLDQVGIQLLASGGCQRSHTGHSHHQHSREKTQMMRPQSQPSRDGKITTVDQLERVLCIVHTPSGNGLRWLKIYHRFPLQTAMKSLNKLICYRSSIKHKNLEEGRPSGQVCLQMLYFFVFLDFSARCRMFVVIVRTGQTRNIELQFVLLLIHPSTVCWWN